MSLTKSEMNEIISRVKYKGWRFHTEGVGISSLFLQVRFLARDNDSKDPLQFKQHHGRKWLLSKHMTVSEIVSTCLKAVLTAEEHEAREKFLYDGVSIYNPHLDIEALVNIAHLKDERK